MKKRVKAGWIQWRFSGKDIFINTFPPHGRKILQLRHETEDLNW